MSTVLHPVGPQPARVYWVRRLVAMMTLVVVVTVLGAMVSVARGAVSAGDANPADRSTAEEADGAGGAGDGASADADDDAADDDAAAGEEEDGEAAVADGGDDAAGTDDADPTVGATAEEGDVAAPVACGPTDLTLTLVPDATAYAEEDEPVLTLTITNTGSTACTVDAGPAEHEILITSGEDRIWSSQDCAGAGRERLLLLQPGGQDVTELTWPSVRSDEACTEGLPAPRAGTYSAVASLIGTTSGSAVFTLG